MPSHGAPRRARSLGLALLGALALVQLAPTFVGLAPGPRTPSFAGRPGAVILQPLQGLTARSAFGTGDAVEAMCAEDGAWYSGTVDSVTDDGSYVVKWDDPDGGPETETVTEENMKAYVPPIPLDQLVVGQKYKGTIVNTAPFGAFVNFGAERDGLVHISAIKEGFVENIDDEVEPGQEVDVWLKNVGDDGKIGLVMVESKLQGGGGGGRRPQADLTPFADLEWGTKLSGKVVSVTNFGAFVSVEPPEGGEAAQGLVHISELSDDYVEDIGSIVQEGQEVEVSIKDVDVGSGKMSLSMKSS